MLNKNDKRNIIIIILVLVVIIGVFIGIRSCKHNDSEPKKENPPIVKPDDPIKEPDDNGKENNDSVIEESKDTTKPVNRVPNTVGDEEEIYPVLSFPTTYYLVNLNEEFTLPELPTIDENGNSIQVHVTYKFLEIGSNEYVPSTELSTSKPGIYEITYYVENSRGYVSRYYIYVEIVDEKAPVIEGYITRVDTDGSHHMIPVLSGEFIHEKIEITFYDNDEIDYVEYYNAFEDTSIDGDNLEEEAMPNVVTVDKDTNFTLEEEGEYHIRAYDRSGNVVEYVVTIDTTKPVTEVSYEQVGNNLTKVIITSNEELQPLEGYTLSEDKMVLTRVYQGVVSEEVILLDRAGNEVTLSLSFNPVKISIYQNDQETGSTQLNKNDGVIKVLVNRDDIILTYTIDDSMEYTYIKDSELTVEGNYVFKGIIDNTPIYMEFYISAMGIED